jgi:hydrogenase nickel incorporation protein HypB
MHDHGPGEHHGESHEHSHSHTHSHDHTHEHAHDHDHDHGHDEFEVSTPVRKAVPLNAAVLDKNDRQADRNRGYFRALGLVVLNVLSSPGSGKTTLLGETVKRLGSRAGVGIIVGDLATDNDAARLRACGAPVVQVNTGTMCHLESEMVAKAAGQLDLPHLDLLIVENVGNLVCPASYDLGEDFRVVLTSVTEGEDKPLKYPPMFQSADVVVVSKIDLAEACDWNRELALENIRKAAPRAAILEVSARKGQGMDVWCDRLLSEVQSRKSRGLV